MAWDIHGEENYREFADDLETISARIPYDVLEKGIQDTAEELVHEIRMNIKQTSTPKGGTLDSRTSPYSPGGENDSSDDNLHIVDREAWKILKTGQKQYTIQVHKNVQNRAYWLERGTRDHGPDGENPMHFYVGGNHIVMRSPSREPETDDPQADIQPPENLEVEGVDAYHFFESAVDTIKRRNSLERNISRRWKKVLNEELSLT